MGACGSAGTKRRVRFRYRSGIYAPCEAARQYFRHVRSGVITMYADELVHDVPLWLRQQAVWSSTSSKYAVTEPARTMHVLVFNTRAATQTQLRVFENYFRSAAPCDVVFIQDNAADRPKDESFAYPRP